MSMISAIWFILYNIFVVPVIYFGFYAGSLFHHKIKKGLAARKGLLKSLKREISSSDENKTRILFHSSSAGEWQQALPIIEKLKALEPDLFIMASYFSPSGFKFAKNPPQVDLKFYLPLDSYFTAKRLFKLTRPDLWVISKLDIWPNHVFAASDLGIPIVVTSATLAPDSGRDKGISKSFNKIVYSRISHFFPISEDTVQRFMMLVPDRGKYTVAGDTRYDHVYNRSKIAENAGDLTIFKKKRGITIIAGSTWPSDEKHLLPALGRLLVNYPDIQAIIVPHEIHEYHLRDIESMFGQFEIKTMRYTDLSPECAQNTRVIIFNAIGMLARLYKHTDIAFIGGSFGKGIHNVMEPAIFGQPVLFGPRHLNSDESVELLNHGAAFKVTNDEEIYHQIEFLINNEDKRSEMGTKARNLIMDHTGATDTIIEKLKEIFDIIS